SAAQRRTLERGRNLLRAPLGEHAAFEIERVASLGDPLRPAPSLAGGRTAARRRALRLASALRFGLAGCALCHDRPPIPRTRPTRPCQRRSRQRGGTE